MVSDKIKAMIDEYWDTEGLCDTLVGLLPKIKILERCEQILKHDNRELKTGKCEDCGCGIHYGHYKSCKHSRTVHLAKALEATHES